MVEGLGEGPNDGAVGFKDENFDGATEGALAARVWVTLCNRNKDNINKNMIKDIVDNTVTQLRNKEQCFCCYYPQKILKQAIDVY